MIAAIGITLAGLAILAIVVYATLIGMVLKTWDRL